MMAIKFNCWEVMKCGKGPSEDGNGKSDICPIVFESSANNLNGGINGGRVCWVIAGEYYKDKVICSKFKRKDPCFACEFRYKVMAEEGLLNVCRSTSLLLNDVRH
jgi:hypothetical protein